MSELADITLWEITKIVLTVTVPIGIVITGMSLGRWGGELVGDKIQPRQHDTRDTIEFIGLTIGTVAGCIFGIWLGFQIAATI